MWANRHHRHFLDESLTYRDENENSCETFTLEIPEDFYERRFSHHKSNFEQGPLKIPSSRVKLTLEAKVKKFTDLLKSDFQAGNAHLPPFSPGTVPETRLKKLADNVANKNI